MTVIRILVFVPLFLSPVSLPADEPVTFQYSDGTRTNGIAPMSPKDSLGTMKTHADLKVELIAAEPQIADPVAIDFGPDGRVWVAEMIDYARGAEEEFESTGRVSVLADRNGDGQYEQSVVFIDGLRFPTDVKVWRKGALICDAPDIIYAEDANNDGRADERKVLFTGFETYNGQARVNSLQWGLDNWVYGSGGLFGGMITGADGRVHDLRGRDFRMRPDTLEIEPVTGRSQQSRVRDDWGNWFGCDNEALAKHYPVSEADIRRNPFVAPPATSVSVPAGENAGQLFPPEGLVMFKLSGASGRATAACGIGIYRDEVLGKDYFGNSFTCEPVNQLVYRQVLSRDGAVIRGHRAASEQKSEFLTSTDRWFRPVQARTGLDGGIWVVDMYRYVIEHARWIPEEVLAELDVFAGQGMGRIYRVLPKHTPTVQSVSLHKLSPVQLVAALNSHNGVQRDLVHQLLVWQQSADRSVIEALVQVAQTSEIPAARLSAMCTLDGLNQLSESLILKMLKDAHGEVRRHAVRLSARWLSAPGPLTTAVTGLTNDPAYEVRLQLASILDRFSPDVSASLIVSMLSASADEYQTSAALSSLTAKNITEVIRDVLPQESLRDSLSDSLMASAAGMADSTALHQILSLVLKTETRFQPWQMVMVAQLLDGLDRRKDALPEFEPTIREQLAKLQQHARAVLDDSQAAETDLAGAMMLIGRASGAVSRPLLGESDAADADRLAMHISPQFTADIQTAALRAVVRRGELSGAQLLLSRLNATTPAVRREIVSAVLTQQSWRSALLDAIESKELTSGDFDAAQRDQIVTHPDRTIRQRAERLLASTVNANRRQLVDDWQDVASLIGDAAAGRQIYAKRCALCHKLEGVGYAVGPDLAALTRRSTNFLLTSILDPNRDADGRYQGYVAVTDDGRSFNGLLVNETGTSITLREQESKEHVLLRNRVEELRATGKSLMPEGLEKDIPKQDMAHLIAYLMEIGPAPKSFDGNHPQTLRADAQGEIVLTPETAALAGRQIAYFPKTDSDVSTIRLWNDVDDMASWQVQVPEAQEFAVWIEASCHDIGGDLRIDGGESMLKHLITPTGSWDRITRTLAGTVRLTAGHNTVTLRRYEKLRGEELMWLRRVQLIPTVDAQKDSDKPSLNPAEVASRLLDDQIPEADRLRLIEQTQPISAAVIRAMAADLPEDETEEYRRIPWIWRVAIAAGKRNESSELLSVLDVSLPRSELPLRDWQAVVVGGGIINGISLSGGWPRERIDRLVAGNFELQPRWEGAIAKAIVMSDNTTVRMGTRYDALRMAAMRPWTHTGKLLSRYLAAGIDDELQMGAISACSDMPAADAGRMILENLSHYSDSNRTIALNALLRTAPRSLRLLSAVESGTVSSSVLSAELRSQLLEHSDSAVRKRAQVVLK